MWSLTVRRAKGRFSPSTCRHSERSVKYCWDDEVVNAIRTGDPSLGRMFHSLRIFVFKLEL